MGNQTSTRAEEAATTCSIATSNATTTDATTTTWVWECFIQPSWTAEFMALVAIIATLVLLCSWYFFYDIPSCSHSGKEVKCANIKSQASETETEPSSSSDNELVDMAKPSFDEEIADRAKPDPVEVRPNCNFELMCEHETGPIDLFLQHPRIAKGKVERELKDLFSAMFFLLPSLWILPLLLKWPQTTFNVLVGVGVFWIVLQLCQIYCRSASASSTQGDGKHLAVNELEATNIFEDLSSSFPRPFLLGLVQLFLMGLYIRGLSRNIVEKGKVWQSRDFVCYLFGIGIKIAYTVGKGWHDRGQVHMDFWVKALCEAKSENSVRWKSESVEDSNFELFVTRLWARCILSTAVNSGGLLVIMLLIPIEVACEWDSDLLKVALNVIAAFYIIELDNFSTPVKLTKVKDDTQALQSGRGYRWDSGLCVCVGDEQYQNCVS